MDSELKPLLDELVAAIHTSVYESPQIADIIERIQDAGYDPEVFLNAKIVICGRQPRRPEVPARSKRIVTFSNSDIDFLKEFHIRVNC